MAMRSYYNYLGIRKMSAGRIYYIVGHPMDEKVAMDVGGCHIGVRSRLRDNMWPNVQHQPTDNHN